MTSNGPNTPEQKMRNWIDNADYEDLLRRWRFAATGDPYFQGEMGDYYSKKMREKRLSIPPEHASDASKSIGWEK